MANVKRIGLFGCSIPGLIEGALRASELDEGYEFISLELLPESSGKRFQLPYLGVRKWFRLLSCIKQLDILIIVFVENTSNIAAKIAHAFGVKVVYYWLGSDVYNMMQGKLANIEKECEADLHVAYGENLVEELAEHSIVAELLTTPPSLPTEIASMPNSHAVLLSIPDARHEFYGYSTLMKLVRDFPDIPFYIVRSERPDLYDEPNIIFKGCLSSDEMNDLFNEVSISIRYPDHDGTSLISMEALIKGKFLISKSKFPYALQARTYEELKEAFSQMLRKPLIPDIEGHRYAVKAFSRKEAGLNWDKCFKKLFA